jgi:hypothetical protein
MDVAAIHPSEGSVMPVAMAAVGEVGGVLEDEAEGRSFLLVDELLRLPHGAQEQGKSGTGEPRTGEKQSKN